ncbi:MAG: AAA family ATPase [Proteobacteria bacterium]|nr:MAG: AAA family ATPase [Pseudomonadota bacterium]PIE68090.1 MAG: AAA family ATPase [Deltaproteobacteria bacterium]
MNQPNYIPQGDEIECLKIAQAEKIPAILKGPTGCGKTRFVEYVAHMLELPLITVSCHEDLTASDLVGRYVFKNNETVWEDGPLTLAARFGAICYLDEIVEARNDTTVIIHSLTDDRRLLYIDKTREVIRAHERFMMIMSYNPGYQSVLKDLKQSTKQRFMSLVFNHPDIDTETRIITSETGLDETTARQLASLGQKIRNLHDFGLAEGVSSRLLTYAARMTRSGMHPVKACRVAIAQSLTDDPLMTASLMDIVELYFSSDAPNNS